MRLCLTPIDYYIYVFGLGASGIHTLHSEDT